MYKDKKSGVTYEINDGEVSEIKKSKVRVCTDGKNLLISKEEFPPPWKYACDGEFNVLKFIFHLKCLGCTMNGKIICKGTVVRVCHSDHLRVPHLPLLCQDLYRWWFMAQCDRGLMRPIGRQWSDVASDPRFRGV